MHSERRNFSRLFYFDLKEKKFFQSNAKHPLSNRPYFIVNKFERAGECGGCTMRSKLNKFKHVREGGRAGPRPCTGNPLPVNIQNGRQTRPRILNLPLCWRAV